jgi:hypothetical protein
MPVGDSMKLVLCLAAAAVLAACTTPGMTPSGQPVAKPAQAAANDPTKRCSVSSSLGSNMKKQTCSTQAEREAAAAAGKGSVDAAQAAMRQGIPQD